MPSSSSTSYSLRRLIWWSSLGLFALVAFLNIWVALHHHPLLDHHDPTSSSSSALSDFLTSSSSSSSFTTQDTQQALHPELAHPQPPNIPQRPHAYAIPNTTTRLLASTTTNNTLTRQVFPKTLIGILSSDSRNDCSYRKRHRALFQDIWKDRRTCSLPELRRNLDGQQEHCQVVYTFVIGANPSGPTEIVNNDTVPLLYPHRIDSAFEDVNQDDVTRLNIRENMNDGKSQTFFYFASLILEEFSLDYAMKLDADSILHLHDYLLFAHHHLPPPPYNVNVFGGALRDKAYWPEPENPNWKPRLESFWGNEYEGVHLYLAGQCYIVSLDLCRYISYEAPYSKLRVAQGGYLEGHEDHDISSMVFHSPTPIHMITIGKSQRFWEHPVKGQPRWERIQKREMARMKQELFEGKQLRLY